MKVQVNDYCWWSNKKSSLFVQTWKGKYSNICYQSIFHYKWKHIVISECVYLTFWETYLCNMNNGIAKNTLRNFIASLIRCGMLSPTKKLYKLYLQHQTGPSQLNIWLSVLHTRGSARGGELPWMIFQLYVSSFTLLCKFILLLHKKRNVNIMLIPRCTSM